MAGTGKAHMRPDGDVILTVEDLTVEFKVGKDKIVKAYQELQPQVKDKIDQAKAGDKESANWLKDKWTPILKAYNKAKEVKI